MSSPQERLEADVKIALKAGEKERLTTLRMLLSEVRNEILLHSREVDEERFVALVRKAIKQRHEAATQFRAGVRIESAEQEEREALMLAAYLPQAVSEDELAQAIEALIAERGLSGPAAMGVVMKEILARFGQRAEGATVSRLARQALARQTAAG